MLTSYDKFFCIANCKQYLKKGVTLEKLKAQATQMSENEVAKCLQNAREALYTAIFERKA